MLDVLKIRQLLAAKLAKLRLRLALFWITCHEIAADLLRDDRLAFRTLLLSTNLKQVELFTLLRSHILGLFLLLTCHSVVSWLQAFQALHNIAYFAVELVGVLPDYINALTFVLIGTVDATLITALNFKLLRPAVPQLFEVLLVQNSLQY